MTDSQHPSSEMLVRRPAQVGGPSREVHPGSAPKQAASHVLSCNTSSFRHLLGRLDCHGRPLTKPRPWSESHPPQLVSTCRGSAGVKGLNGPRLRPPLQVSRKKGMAEALGPDGPPGRQVFIHTETTSKTKKIITEQFFFIKAFCLSLKKLVLCCKQTRK